VSLLDSLKSTAQAAGETAKSVGTDIVGGAREAAITQAVPGRGTLWDYGDQGVVILPTGGLILGALATYGVIRFIGR